MNSTQATFPPLLDVGFVEFTVRGTDRQTPDYCPGADSDLTVDSIVTAAQVGR
ncbi:MAG: hypothetical protein ACRDSO_15130 [Pseudonocardiaceae bacterium]